MPKGEGYSAQLIKPVFTSATVRCSACGNTLKKGDLFVFCGRNGCYCVHRDGQAGCWDDKCAPGAVESALARTEGRRISHSPSPSPSGGSGAQRSNGSSGVQGSGATQEQLLGQRPPAPASVPVAAPSDLMSQLASALEPYLQDRLRATVDEERVLELIEEATGQLTRTLTIKHADKPELTNLGLVHRQLPDLIDYLQDGEPVLIYGAAGGGKTHAAEQAALALGVPCEVFTVAPMTSESLFRGMIDAMGVNREERFIECVEKGNCLILIDEAFRGNPALYPLLNSLWANGYLITRTRGKVTAGPNLYWLLSDNTNGRGQDPAYPEAQQMEFATLDRITYLEWEYDTDLEGELVSRLGAAYGLSPATVSAWLTWVRSVRPGWQQGDYGQVFPTPRGALKGIKRLASSRDWLKTAKACVFRGIDSATERKLLTQHPLPVVAVEVKQ